MKRFIIKFLMLLSWIFLLILIGLYLPPTKSSKNSLLFAQLQKNTLLKQTPSPRILFVGGSNLSFGLDSKMIIDSLHINVADLGLDASIGLKYMLRNTIDHIRPGDIVVVCPEYQQFYGHYADGEFELLSIIFDVAPNTKHFLDARQCFTMTKFIPQYVASKLNPLAYLTHLDTNTVGVYDRKAYNVYGDAYIHWTLPKEQVTPYAIDGAWDDDTYNYLNSFRRQIEQKKARLLITFPPYQDISYDRYAAKIKKVEQRLSQDAYTLLGSPQRYRFPDRLILNTPYHLVREGVTIRTNRLIADLKKTIRQ